MAIQEVLESSRQATRQVTSDLETARATVDATVKQWAEIHAELVHSVVTVNTSGMPTRSIADEDASLFGASGRIEGVKRLTKLVDSEVLASPHVFDILRSSVRAGVGVPLPLVSIALGSCLSEMTGRVAERLQALTLEYESIAEDNSSQRPPTAPTSTPQRYQL